MVYEFFECIPLDIGSILVSDDSKMQPLNRGKMRSNRLCDISFGVSFPSKLGVENYMFAHNVVTAR